MNKKLLVFVIIFLIGALAPIVSAAEILDELHLNIQTTDSFGNVVTGTFPFVFNISTSDTCSPVVYSNSTSLTTDSRGILSYYLQNTNLDYDQQYYLCYYRDGSLIETSKIARTPYSFSARNISLSGVSIDSNLNMGSYNSTASYFFGDGSGLTNLNVGEIDLSAYATNVKVDSLGNFSAWDKDYTDLINTPTYLSNFTNDLGFYNSTNFVISDYYLNSNPSSFWNDTFATFNKTYADTLYDSLGTISNSLSWNRSGTDVFLANTGDSVGIGTTSPVGKFEVDEQSNLDLMALFTARGGNEKVSQSIFRTKDAGGNNVGGAIGHDGTNLILSGLSGVAGNEHLVIDSSGNVGIGTTSPGGKLEISDGTNTISSGANADRWAFTTAPFNYIQSEGQILIQPTGDLVLNSAGSETMRLKNGNVGIGTTSPSYKLDVFESKDGTSAIQIQNDNAGTASASELRVIAQGNNLLFDSYGDSHSTKANSNWIYSTATGSDLIFGTESTARMTIDNGGNVGIGTTSPSAKLEVTGDVIIDLT